MFTLYLRDSGLRIYDPMGENASERTVIPSWPKRCAHRHLCAASVGLDVYRETGLSPSIGFNLREIAKITY